MRGWTKALMWLGILLACAAVGAFVASRSNPFPPGVEDPGATDGSGESPSPTAGPEVWTLTMQSRTTHTYRVGGSCTSDWRMEARIRLFPEGKVEGHGAAHLLPGAQCDFPNAQVQSRRIALRISGHQVGGALRLRFDETGPAPFGSQDLGAFSELVSAIRPSVAHRSGAGDRIQKRIERSDGDVFAAVFGLRLTG